MQMCIVHFKERERLAPGARMDDRVLFIEEVSYESVREPNKLLLVLLSQAAPLASLQQRQATRGS
jgi:hypothetical protein